MFVATAPHVAHPLQEAPSAVSGLKDNNHGDNDIAFYLYRTLQQVNNLIVLKADWLLTFALTMGSRRDAAEKKVESLIPGDSPVLTGFCCRFSSHSQL